jgi:hypothetical protein
MSDSIFTGERPSQDQPKSTERKTHRVIFGKIGRLLGQRWPEYFLEIIVVIIGITISLTLSNFQEEAANRKLEQTYLKSLLEDINADLKELEVTIHRTEIVIQSGNSLLEQSSSETLTSGKEEFVKLIQSVIDRPNFVSKNATFYSLKSSANFHLVNDIELKNLLFEYDQLYQSLKTVESAELQETVFITGPYIIKYIPLIDSKRTEAWLKSLDIEKILGEVEFGNNLVLRLGTRQELLDGYQESLKIAHQIKEALEKNLN